MRCESDITRLTRQQRLQLIVLRSFTDAPSNLDSLLDLSSRQWKNLLLWLDVSGLALYFLARLRELGACHVLPENVHRRLLQNLDDNTARMKALARETTAIQSAFQSENIDYVVLKGFSLASHSVPSFELRSQLDIDFLVASDDLATAQHVLLARGYHLHGHSGRSWEYKDDPAPRTSIKQLYQDTGSRSAELHSANNDTSRQQLQRSETCVFGELLMPVLSPEDLFLGQALHFFKHCMSDGARASHGIELYRHITFRHDDEAFWKRVRTLANDDAFTSFALGLVLSILAEAMGPFAPDSLTCWTTAQLPDFACRWVSRFGLETALGRLGGYKVSMILHDELEAHGYKPVTRHRASTIPRRLPPRIEHARPGETFLQKAGRHGRQLRFILLRLRFHIVEGTRLYIERARWKRTVRHEDKQMTIRDHA